MAGTSSPLADGYYKVAGTWYKILLVKGTSAVIKGTTLGDLEVYIRYGDFGDADKEICETTGQTRFHLELSFSVHQQVFKELGVITENGMKITTKSMMGIAEFESITEEEATLMEEGGDPIDAPPAPYKLQPEHQGQLLWFTGPPGLGKSTSAQLLARNHGYVYYEADCFNSCKNPYIPVDVPDPSMAQVNQKQLKGKGSEERIEVVRKLMDNFGSFLKGDDNSEVFQQYFSLMCEDIERERERIGGDWAIASVVMLRDMRDFIRSKLGPDLVFVMLEMDLEETVERLSKRHHGDETTTEMMKAVYKRCEPAGEDEEKVVTVKVSSEMSPEDVIKKALEMLK